MPSSFVAACAFAHVSEERQKTRGGGKEEEEEGVMGGVVLSAYYCKATEVASNDDDDDDDDAKGGEGNGDKTFYNNKTTSLMTTKGKRKDDEWIEKACGFVAALHGFCREKTFCFGNGGEEEEDDDDDFLGVLTDGKWYASQRLPRSDYFATVVVPVDDAIADSSFGGAFLRILRKTLKRCVVDRWVENEGSVVHKDEEKALKL